MTTVVRFLFRIRSCSVMRNINTNFESLQIRRVRLLKRGYPLYHWFLNRSWTRNELHYVSFWTKSRNNIYRTLMFLPFFPQKTIYRHVFLIIKFDIDLSKKKFLVILRCVTVDDLPYSDQVPRTTLRGVLPSGVWREFSNRSGCTSLTTASARKDATRHREAEWVADFVSLINFYTRNRNFIFRNW